MHEFTVMGSSLLLLSGGVDSTCAIKLLQPSAALFIDYGQHCARAERQAATMAARELKVALATVEIDCSSIGQGDLVGKVSHRNSPAREWWPFRNQLLASLGGAYAFANDFSEIIFATVASDSFHADGTPSFFETISKLMSLQEGAIFVSAPLIQMTTTDLVAKSGLGMDLLAWTHSCHKSNISCGQCSGCWKRNDVFRAAGLLRD